MQCQLNKTVDVKMFLMVVSLVLAFVFHVTGFATPNWTKVGQGYFNWGLWQTCVLGVCVKRTVTNSDLVYMTIVKVLECFLLSFMFFAAVVASILTYQASNFSYNIRWWRRTSMESFGNALGAIIAVLIYGIMQEGTLDYSFYLTIVGALFSIIAGILGFSSKFPESIVSAYRGNNPQMAPQAAYPPQFNQAAYPSHGMTPAMIGPQFNPGEMNQAYAMDPIAYRPQFDQENPNSNYGVAPPYESLFDAGKENETAPPSYDELSIKDKEAF